MNNPIIFDLKSLRTQQKRSLLNKNYDNFLFKEIGRRLIERLFDIKKDFNQALEISSKPNILNDIMIEKNFFKNKNLRFFIRSGLGGDLEINQELIPVVENSMNLIFSNLSLHWANDLVGILYQIRQILKPDGFFIASMFGENTLIELRESFRIAETSILGEESNRISPFIDIKTAGNLLQRSGFSLNVSDIDKLQIQFSEPIDLLNEIR